MRGSGHDLEDFRECRSVVCMIDRVCFVMYRCNYELLISPYNLFHPTINTLQPGRLLKKKVKEPKQTRNDPPAGLDDYIHDIGQFPVLVEAIVITKLKQLDPIDANNSA